MRDANRNRDNQPSCGGHQCDLNSAGNQGGFNLARSLNRLEGDDHTDNRSKESEERFKEISEAYEILSDNEKRRVYDQYGAQGLKRGPGGPAGGGFDFTDAIDVFMRDFGGFGGLGDIFGQRGRGGRPGRQRGESLKVSLPLTLTDVASGVTRTVSLAVLDGCESCDITPPQQGLTGIGIVHDDKNLF